MGNIVVTSGLRPSICDSSGLPMNKWTTWYPYSQQTMSTLTTDCLRTLSQLNQTNIGATKALPGMSNDNCANVYSLIDCVQENMAPSLQLNFAGGRVLLGLTPAILTLLTPSIGEIALLGTRRPLLSFLISLACPGVSVPRVMQYDDPLETLLVPRRRRLLLEPCDELPTEGQQDNPRLSSVIISALQYLAVLGAAANVIILSVEIGFKAIFAWKAGEWSLVIMWSILATVVEQIFPWIWHRSSTMRNVHAEQDESEQESFSLIKRFRRATLRELTLCKEQPGRRYVHRAESEQRWVKLFNYAASLASVIVLIFGTALFSSLLFIATIDALGITGRYVASAAVCRAVIMYEMSGIIASEERTEKELAEGSEASA